MIQRTKHMLVVLILILVIAFGALIYHKIETHRHLRPLAREGRMHAIMADCIEYYRACHRLPATIKELKTSVTDKEAKFISQHEEMFGDKFDITILGETEGPNSEKTCYIAVTCIGNDGFYIMPLKQRLEVIEVQGLRTVPPENSIGRENEPE
jgi:hypothetical protein